jgi:hypothetical protein
MSARRFDRMRLLDRLGGVASASCAAHCLTMSLAPALVAFLGAEFLASEALEWGLFVAAVVFALAAAGLGFRVHRDVRVLAGFGAGLAALTAARLGEALDLFEGTLVLAVLGGGALVASHLVSARQTRRCRASCGA